MAETEQTVRDGQEVTWKLDSLAFRKAVREGHGTDDGSEDASSALSTAVSDALCELGMKFGLMDFDCTGEIAEQVGEAINQEFCDSEAEDEQALKEEEADDAAWEAERDAIYAAEQAALQQADPVATAVIA
jgi:hypothetical protein